jgi:hypothetical protein
MRGGSTSTNSTSPIAGCSSKRIFDHFKHLSSTQHCVSCLLLLLLLLVGATVVPDVPSDSTSQHQEHNHHCSCRTASTTLGCHLLLFGRGV